MSAMAIISECLLRIEHKVDLLLKDKGFKVHPQMHFVGQACPVCNRNIDYQIDIVHSVVVRVCDCKTGKIPSATPLLKVSEEDSNGSSSRRKQQR